MTSRLVITRLEYTSEEDLRKAAEAVVDAAVCCYEEKEIGRLYASDRNMLIDIVLRDPEVTGKLFRGGIFSEGSLEHH